MKNIVKNSFMLPGLVGGKVPNDNEHYEENSQ